MSAKDKERLYLFDTTLRDGAQTNGVDFSVEDKGVIARMLDELGVDYVEGGYPGANPTDTEFFASKPRFRNATFTAFGMTKRAGRSADNDPGLAALFDSAADAICLVAKTWDYHVDVALGITNEENVEAIADSVKAVRQHDREPMIDCEHFFDGYKANPDYAIQCAKAAFHEGARWIVLCDTNGGTLPDEIERIIGEVTKHIPGTHLGIHAHNDTENAVANSLAAVRAGVRQIQGTLNGIGERCGNANLVSLIPTLKLKPAFAEKFETGVSDEALQSLTHVSRAFDELLKPCAQPAGALCRRLSLRDQGRDPRLGDHEGARDLRARAAGPGRQQPPASGVRPGRQVQSHGRALARRHRGRQGRSEARYAPARGQGT